MRIYVIGQLDTRLYCNCLLYFLLQCYDKRTKNAYLFIHLQISMGYLLGAKVVLCADDRVVNKDKVLSTGELTL